MKKPLFSSLIRRPIEMAIDILPCGVLVACAAAVAFALLPTSHAQEVKEGTKSVLDCATFDPQLLSVPTTYNAVNFYNANSTIWLEVQRKPTKEPGISATFTGTFEPEMTKLVCSREPVVTKTEKGWEITFK